ncbi:hypothetical protein F5146DRAFT_997629 [Armillaria mellea]|nr:hypothetical protein F5146DRAFT_997629 [Armillaria mellea]
MFEENVDPNMGSLECGGLCVRLRRGDAKTDDHRPVDGREGQLSMEDATQQSGLRSKNGNGYIGNPLSPLTLTGNGAGYKGCSLQLRWRDSQWARSWNVVERGGAATKAVTVTALQPVVHGMSDLEQSNAAKDVDVSRKSCTRSLDCYLYKGLKRNGSSRHGHLDYPKSGANSNKLGFPADTNTPGYDFEYTIPSSHERLHPRKKQDPEIIAFQDVIPPWKGDIFSFYPPEAKKISPFLLDDSEAWFSTNEVQQLDEDVLDLIFDAACRGNAGMVAILGSICKQFRQLVVKIADETVVINDYVLDDPGPATTPEMALKVFGDGGDERKRLRARSLKWKAYNVRLGVLAQVLGTLERVTALTLIGSRLTTRADVILHLPNIHEILFHRCTLDFPGLASFMQALPNLQALRILGPGMIISNSTPFLTHSEPPLTLPMSLESLEVDCPHMWGQCGVDDGERILYWFKNAKNLVWLKLAMTGEVGVLPGNSLIQANRKSLLSLSLALVEHPKQCWDYSLKVGAPELLDLSVSVQNTPIDLYFISDFFHHLQSPKLSSLDLHIHILPELTVRWHSYHDKVAFKRYSPALQASFDVSKCQNFPDLANHHSGQYLWSVPAEKNGGPDS